MERKFNDQEVARRNKLQRLQEKNQNPFLSTKFTRDYNSLSYKKAFDKFTKDELHTNNTKVSLAGRIMAIRQTFLMLRDFYGNIQLYINKKNYPQLFQMLKDDIDIGDIVGISGVPMKTNTGELTVNVSVMVLLSKALKPLPEK
jgi:lysyl-tRNA synthetase class 2